LKLGLGFALGAGLLQWDFSCMKIKFYCINEVIKVMVEKIGIIQFETNHDMGVWNIFLTHAIFLHDYL
jgi:hypothetical protein